MSAGQLVVIVLYVTAVVLFFRITATRHVANTNAPTNAERLAAWERRLGAHRAKRRLRVARLYQLIDQLSARQIVAIARSIHHDQEIAR